MTAPVSFSSGVQTRAMKRKIEVESEGRTYQVLKPGDSSDGALLRSWGIANPTHLMGHVLFFVERDGTFSMNSIKCGFEALHIDNAWLNAAFLETTVIAKMGWASKVEDIAKMLHSADSHVFNAEGAVDRDRLKELGKYADANGGLFTKETFDKIRADDKARDEKKAQESGCPFLKGIGVGLGAKAAVSEFDLLLQVAADAAVDGKPAVSYRQFCRFYLQGSSIFREAAAKNV